ncbi:hypothetical protein RFI_35304, partial [Reticulomyxa filosa]
FFFFFFFFFFEREREEGVYFVLFGVIIYMYTYISLCKERKDFLILLQKEQRDDYPGFDIGQDLLIPGNEHVTSLFCVCVCSVYIHKGKKKKGKSGKGKRKREGCKCYIKTKYRESTNKRTLKVSEGTNNNGDDVKMEDPKWIDEFLSFQTPSQKTVYKNDKQQVIDLLDFGFENERSDTNRNQFSNVHDEKTADHIVCFLFSFFF